MGHRLSKIYTRTGDDGTTGLGDGSRVPKDHLRVETFGTVDELNSAIGVVLTYELDEDIRKILTRVQHELFDLGSELAVPGYETIQEKHVTALEEDLDRWNAELPMLKEFILPGGSRAGSFCHMARATCRRAERLMSTLLRENQATDKPINKESARYLNRLSDLLFVLSRAITRSLGEDEVLWKPLHSA